ncbi:MAG: ABC transporter substrate-binding protein [Alphaproteobacteria bacterium]|nr:ABC transporter substrate-binding protein [Alphaproteobacteria bacterium]
MVTRREILTGFGAGALAFAAGTGARAQGRARDELRVAVASEWTALDPHFHSFPANLSIAHHVFDALTATDADERVVPRLAESWRPLGGEGWEFKLRAGVKFSDGSDLTARDVIASIERVPRVPNSPGPLTVFTRPIASMESPDPLTLIIRTRDPSPTLPIMLSAVYVVPARLADATTERFNSGEALIGTGPFKFASWARGDRLILERNDAHWGGASPWRRVEIRIITATASRESALLAGDVDFIQNPSTASMGRLRRESAVALFQAPSTRITYLQFNQKPEVLPDVAGTNGRNPFADKRVRRAVSIAIPRAAIAERVMDGLSVPAGQIVAPRRFGHEPSLGLEPYDIDRAKALLAEAGYPNGFEVALSTPNDRNINGVQIAQTIAASLTRAGVRTSVNAVPLNVWLSQWRGGRYSFLMHGFGPPLESLQPVAAMAATKNMQAALGVSNESGYSSPALDEIITAALREIDDRRREDLMFQAARIIREDTAVICLHHEVLVFAARRGLQITARGDERLYATDIRPA